MTLEQQQAGTRVYRYVDAHGQLLYEVVRTPPKRFYQRRPDGDRWAHDLDGIQRVPYRLPQLHSVATLGGVCFVVEGEKDAERLAAELKLDQGVLTVAVTTSAQGAGWHWPQEWAEHFRGLETVYVIADNDDLGVRAARQRASVVRAAVGDVRLVERLPGVGDKGDVSDWLDAGNTVDDLWRQCDGAPNWPLAEDGRLDGEGGADGPVEPFFIDWSAFWRRERNEPDWLYEDVLAFGRSHAVYAGHKAGKSLFLLWTAVQLVQRDDVAVAYFDYEQTEDDLHERLEDMGIGPSSDLRRLQYALLPALPPLDTPLGAEALMSKVEAVQRDWPEAHVCVIIDTTGRALVGEENSADTIRAYYRNTGIALKRRGSTVVRLDHAGKDATKGQRGTSGKGDDVDLIWRLSATEGGVELHRDAARMGWVPERVAFQKRADPLRYERTERTWVAGTREVAALLDKIGVAVDATERQAMHSLRDAGHGKRSQVVRSALRWRRDSGYGKGPE